jgi:hypothetical protein
MGMERVEASRCVITDSKVTPEMVVSEDGKGKWQMVVMTEVTMLLPDGRRVYCQGRGVLLGNTI